ncbi:MAG: hypothetical protein LBV57_02210 [Candidatus Symbiothrix sp.]|jgi:G:T/U-mismatch repair DNA glycosylase|nr:hypothetical protein [Candidatus Symbiothrix sp.]
MQTEIHPWNWYVPENARTLIIGTFPPTLRNWSFDFFYPNKNNYFWKIIASIAGKPLNYLSGDEAIRERKRLLNHLQLGLSDMGKIICRTADSSLDENLQVIEYMNIFRLLSENPSIRKIIFTSSSGKSSAMRWFKEYLSVHDIPFQIPKGERPLRQILDLAGRKMEIVLLYSTSPRAGAAISLERLTGLFREEIVSV